MRSSKSRSRSKSNRNRSMGNIVNRVFDSSGPEGKVRGTPQQIIDKYTQLARDAQLSNDRVAFENFQQHAEHYTRMLGEAMREQEQFRVQTQGSGGQGGQDRGGDGQPRDRSRDDQDEAPRYEAAREDRGREDRGREDRAPQRRGSDDVIDMGAEADAGLVETPENAAPVTETPAAEEAPAAPRPPRRRRPRKDSAAGEAGDAKPEAAE